MSQERRCRVTAGHEASYADPITLDAGETLQVSEKTDAWNGNPDWIWVWCTNQQGKSGDRPNDTLFDSFGHLYYYKA